ncbi:hypothetical protein [Stappia sp. ES.058]|uniref:hypothetical protein n=1 Tax=Stappia sp. ES.058 TaxID=1881061 RepID=UPI00087C0480|nr:hypothetical protein [Stappia sp. ES.058]SDU02146.1 hypothetical protein SAMN05428979_1158 [Stappia sp. ES.058]
MQHPSSCLSLRLATNVTLLLGIVAAGQLALEYWPGRTFDSATSGVWMSLAVDYAEGVLYRPLLGDMGYGGTRYMPLFFMIHGSLIRLFGNPTMTGVLLMQASVLLMIAAMARLLVLNGVPRALSWGFAAITVCTSLYQQYLTGLNCDYLAAALSLWGLTFYLRKDPSPTRDAVGKALGLLLFVLAFYTKFSTVYAPSAVFLSLVLQRQWRAAAIFSIAALFLIAVFAATFVALSDGRMIQSLAATATGGTDLAFATGMLRRFAKELAFFNPAVGVCFLLALAKWTVDAPTHWRSPLHLTFVMVTLVTIVTFSSRGIAGNHAIPLNAVSLVLAGTAFSGRRIERQVLAGGFATLSLILIACWTPGVPSPLKTIRADNNPTVFEIRAEIARWLPDNGLLASTNPSYAIVAGKTPFLIDYFSLKTFIRTGDPAGMDFLARIKARDFDVLINFNPNARWTPQDGESVALSNHYVAVDTLHGGTILIPRTATQ